MIHSPARASSAPCLGLLLLLGLALSTSSAESAPWHGREILEEGLLRMENPRVAMHPPASLVLEELWRVGGDSDEEGEFFGVIIDLCVGPAGEVYLLDRQLVIQRPNVASFRHEVQACVC